MGILIPEKYGGAGLTYRHYVAVLEELGAVEGGHRPLGRGPQLALHEPYLSSSASDEGNSAGCRGLASGKVVGAWGLTEPEAGSDSGATKTTAVRNGKGWVLNGSKNFITHAGVRRGRRGDGPDQARGPTPTGFRLLSCRSTTPGRHGRQARGQGRDAHLGHGRAHLRGLPGRSTKPFSGRKATGSSRPWRFSTAAGSRSPRCPWASPRAPSTRPWPTPSSAASSVSPIAAFQAIRFKLADMATRSRRPVSSPTEAADAKDAGRKTTLISSQAKLYASEVGGPCRRGGGPDPRRLRLLQGLSRGEALARRQAVHDRRRDERDPAARHRPRIDRRVIPPDRGRNRSTAAGAP